jgi:hypothetical protein
MPPREVAGSGVTIELTGDRVPPWVVAALRRALDAQRRDPIIYAPARFENRARPREHRSRSRRSTARGDPDPEPEPPLAGRALARGAA